ncbi:ATP-binding protein [bacterium]|nr:ATP-binding protein [bacterium]
MIVRACKIAVVSGKGGTGKTLVSTNLAYLASKTHPTHLYDLDVEEPNDHLFFGTENASVEIVKQMVPLVQDDKCDYCGYCSEVCEFHAIITLKDRVMVFPELCHSCYACLELCPQNAIQEGFRDIGSISIITNQNLKLITGTLNVGEMATTALIDNAKRAESDSGELHIYDAPPGTSCPLIESIKGIDFLLLVGEPTPFGLHDLDLIVQMVKKMGIPMGLVINKAMPENHSLEQYGQQNQIPLLGNIPFRRDIAQAYARSELVIQTIPGMEEIFRQILDGVLVRAKGMRQ